MADGRESGAPDAPLVSVVIPTYNHAEFLGTALRSVAAQTYRPLEIIVVDNFSTDHTEQVVAASRVPAMTYVKFANGGIIAASRNVGIRASRGEYVAFLDADDEWAPDKLERQIPHLRDRRLAAVASDLRYVGARRYAPSRRGRAPAGYRDYAYGDIVLDNSIATSSVVARRSQLQEVGGFDEATEFRVIEDWDLWLRLAVIAPLRVLDAPLVTYRIAPRERPRMPILESKLALLDKHQRLGFLTPAAHVVARAAIHRAMGIATFTTDAGRARDSFRVAARLTSSRPAAAIARAAALATYLPSPGRRLAFRLLSWINRWARFT